MVVQAARNTHLRLIHVLMYGMASFCTQRNIVVVSTFKKSSCLPYDTQERSQSLY